MDIVLLKITHMARRAQLSAIKNPADLKNSGVGRRCFIVATGPSLNRLPLELLVDDFVFGVNQSYQAIDHGLPHMDLLVIADPASYQNYAEEIETAQISCRLLRSDAYALIEGKGYDPDRTLCYSFPLAPYVDEGYFARDFSMGIYRGCSVTLDAIQIAYIMGFSEVYILGCDLDYSGSATHFYKNNAHEDASKDIMPIDRVRRSMQYAKTVYKKENRILLNATDGGTLEELGRIAFSSLFEA